VRVRVSLVGSAFEHGGDIEPDCRATSNPNRDAADTIRIA
jgi:hypothetical protein